MDDKPRINIGQTLTANFQLEQDRWLNAQMQFKSGVLFYGTIAVSLLTSMFYLIPAARVIAKDEAKAAAFVDEMDSFRLEVYRYARTKGIDNLTPSNILPLTQDYMALDNKYDALVRKFYLLMFETGFSP